MKKFLKIKLYQEDFLPGFGAYRVGSASRKTHAEIMLNVGDLLSVVAHKKLRRSEIPYVVAETIMHEIIHALEEWAGVRFSEKKVEELIRKYRRAASSGGRG